MKRLTFLLFFSVLLSFGLYAQTVITGTVTDEDGNGIAAAIVRVKDASAATMTDFNGGYSIKVPEGKNILVFSFTGKKEQEVEINGQTKIDVILESSDVQVKDVVITALNIKREEKEVGVTVTTVGNEDITKTHDKSPLTALSGKIAGVNITQASGAPSASTRVIMRGFSSINGNNQPLYIIDGVPLDNSSSGSTSINGGMDFGNGANDLNPEDIESITILKGASGTALYGSRAANGVIIITTNKGKSKKGLGINYSSTVTFDSPLRLPQWQNRYGQGFFGSRDIRENTSWGPRFDGEMRYWGYQVDGKRKIKPYVALPNNVRDFFDVGATYQNVINVSSGSDKTSFYASYSNTSADGIMPQNHDVYNRNTFSMRGSAEIDKVTVSASANYVNKIATYVMTGQGAVSVYNNILQIPRDIPIKELEDYKDPFNNLDNFYSAYMVNPYYVLNEFGNKDVQDRFYGSSSVNYKINQNLQAMFRLGTDITSEFRHVHEPIIDPNGINDQNESWVNTNEGFISEYSRERKEFNSDFIVTYTNNWNHIKLNVMLGHNLNQRQGKYLYTSVQGLDVPEYYNIKNSGSTPTTLESEYMRRLLGVYTNVDLGFYNLLFLTMSYRHDWSSTLPLNHNNFGYPAVNCSFVYSNLFPESIKKKVDLAKLRLGWAKVGNDASPYLVYSTLAQPYFSNGYTGTGLSFPLNGINSYSVGNLIGNLNLSPEFKTEFEIGTDIRIFSGRFTLDLTYFNSIVDHLIFVASLPYSSGFASQTMNLGAISSKGIEALVTVTPIRTMNFSWKITTNFTKDKNIMEQLPDIFENPETGEREYTIMGIGMPATGYTSLSVFQDEQIAVFTVNAPEIVTDKNSPYYGSIIVDRNNGLPITSDSIIKVGTTHYDYMAGVGSEFSYKNLTISFNFDIRKGGLMYSRTAEMTYFSGTNVFTTYNDRQPFVIENSVVEIIKDGEVVGYEENTQPIINCQPNSASIGSNMHDYWGGGAEKLNAMFLLDKSFIKLRDVAVSYTLPKKIIVKLKVVKSAQVSIFGRNLMIWTPSSNRFIDPEATSFGNDLAADYGEWGNTPSIRSIGFNLHLTF